MYDIVIAGGGLTGLRLAQKLEKKNINFLMIEARSFLGGRMRSEYSTADDTYFDLGPTWFWPEFEPNMKGLMNELNLQSFEQYSKGSHTFENQHGMIQRFNTDIPVSHRIDGGVQALIQQFQSCIPSEKYMLNTQVKQLKQLENYKIEVTVLNKENKEVSFTAESVVLAMPPNIIQENIQFIPELSQKSRQSLSAKRTWMASQAKIVVVYNRPFWRENHLSGTANSFKGPLQEIHDASPQNGSSGALFGFFGLTPAERKAFGKRKVFESVTAQLVRLFGNEAENYTDILYKDWAEDKFTAGKQDQFPMTEFPPYQPIDNDAIWGYRLLFASTETSAVAGGHLEGALNAAENILNEIT